MRYRSRMSSDTTKANVPRAEREDAREYDGKLREACERLHQAQQKQAEDSEEWSRELQEAVQGVMEALEQHAELSEAPDGPLAEISERKPHLLHEVDRQKQEHGEMLERADLINEKVARSHWFQQWDVDILRLEAKVLHDMLRLHLVRGDDMVYEALFRDEGGEQE